MGKEEEFLLTWRSLLWASFLGKGEIAVLMVKCLRSREILAYANSPKIAMFK